MADFVVSLRQHEYQTSLGALRNCLQNFRQGCLDIDLKLPTVDTPVHLQLRCSDAYVIGFHGQDGWYHFENEEGGWGKSCGIGSNYNALADVAEMNVMSADNLSSLTKYKSGDRLDTKLVVMAAAVISESLRFATVTTYFTGLFNGLYKTFNLVQVVPVAEMKDKYFLHWDALSKKNDPGVLLKK